MAVGILPGQVNGWPPKCSFDSDTDSTYPPLHTPPSPLSAFNEPSSLSRPFFWEIIPLCELYSIAHIILLPSSLRLSYNQSPPRTGSNNANGVNGTNGHQTHGYVARSDFLRLRLQDFPFSISKIQECVAAPKKYTACRLSSSSVNSEDGLANLIEQAAAVIQWGDLEASVSILNLQHYLLGLTHELRDRLNNAPWLTPHPIPRKRLALIRGRPNLTAGGPIYRAARALNLDLVIIDDEGHWLQPDTDDNRLHREGFIATDMTEDAGVADRIIASIKRYPLPIHGVFTVSDNFFVTAARVADALGLSTNPVSAFETSVDKYRSRLLQDAPGHTARVTSVEELNTLLTAPANGNAAFTPIYPLIVKPTKGWSSECVSKVSTPADLALAVQKATSRHGSAAVIEPFFDGPEIDANFVLLDGEILFWEVADEPPCQADRRDASVQDTFSPEALTLPSALPEREQAVVRDTLRDLLVRAGFRTGVFHVEARVVHSACEYRDVGGGVVDLARKDGGGADTGDKVACKLIEINARPPGYRVSVPSRHTYGVDFFAHMLAA